MELLLRTQGGPIEVDLLEQLEAAFAWGASAAPHLEIEEGNNRIFFVAPSWLSPAASYSSASITVPL